MLYAGVNPGAREDRLPLNREELSPVGAPAKLTVAEKGLDNTSMTVGLKENTITHPLEDFISRLVGPI